MTITHPRLLAEIDSFLAETGMGASYFGKAAVGNSELVSRLRAGRRVWPETETKALSFIMMRRSMARTDKRLSAKADNQGPSAGKYETSVPAEGAA